MSRLIKFSRVKHHEGKSGSLPAFASGDVVNVTDATDIRSITEWHSLSPSSVIRTAIDAPCDALSQLRGAMWTYPVPLE